MPHQKDIAEHAITVIKLIAEDKLRLLNGVLVSSDNYPTAERFSVTGERNILKDQIQEIEKYNL